MLIGINLLYLIPGRVGGTETYARELIPRLATNNNLIIFCGRETATTFQDSNHIKIVTLPLFSTNRFLRILLEQTLLPLLCIRHKITVLFSLGYSAPLIHTFPSVVTIHDLNWYYHPEDFTSISYYMWKFLTTLSAKFSTHVITDSSSSATSLIQVLGLNPSQVTSILHGTPATLKVNAKKMTRPYLFTVLANYPHKNLDTLLRAFNVLSQIYKNLDLVVCGLGKQASSTTRIKYLGYVTREELASLYRGEFAFVFPSAYEGFGYPVLEAMSYGAPVISSNATSLAEVVGEGGMLIDPYDVNGYIEAITKLMDSPKLRQQWIKKGTKRASELKWEDTAAQTLGVLKKAAQL